MVNTIDENEKCFRSISVSISKSGDKDSFIDMVSRDCNLYMTKDDTALLQSSIVTPEEMSEVSKWRLDGVYSLADCSEKDPIMSILQEDNKILYVRLKFYSFLECSFTKVAAIWVNKVSIVSERFLTQYLFFEAQGISSLKDPS